MTRLVDDSGCSMTGMPDDCGSSAIASLRRSCTRWRASIRSVPILKSSTTWDRPTTDDERTYSTPGMPRSWSSIGIVISSSTSVDVMPGPSVWISTFGGANSGNTSIGIRCSCWVPNVSKAMAAANTRKRNFRLDPIIQRNISAPSSPGFSDLDFQSTQWMRFFKRHAALYLRVLYAASGVLASRKKTPPGA